MAKKTPEHVENNPEVLIRFFDKTAKPIKRKDPLRINDYYSARLTVENLLEQLPVGFQLSAAMYSASKTVAIQSECLKQKIDTAGIIEFPFQIVEDDGNLAIFQFSLYIGYKILSSLEIQKKVAHAR